MIAVTTATITRDAVNTMLHLLANSNWSNFQQCARECMFSILNGSLCASISLIYPLESALVYFIRRRAISMASLQSERIIVVVKHQIMTYVLNFLVEIFLIVTYDLRSTFWTIEDCPFYVI